MRDESVVRGYGVPGGTGMWNRMWAAIAVSVLLGQVCWAQGFVLPGVGPVNRSMGGAGTAAPLDTLGALHWNPASISAIPENRFDIAVDLVANQNKIESTLFAGTPMETSGATHSHAGIAPLPAIGVVRRIGDSDWTYGLGLLSIGGFHVNYPTSTTNPIFTPPPPAGAGTGGGFSRLSLLQLVPTLSKRFESGFSIGIAPTITIADAQMQPFPFAAPDDANMDTFYSYQDGMRTRPRWGLGVQAGIYYESPWGINFGLSAKSPQWFEDFEFFGSDEVGAPRTLSAEIEYPLILSGGVSFKPVEDVLVAADLRWVDYESTPIFGESATFNPDGSLNGLGWKSVMLVALGVQWQAAERLAVRTGYSYNPSPIQDDFAFASVSAPAVYEHIFNLGLSFDITSRAVLSLTCVHAFENSVSGPFLSPAGPVPASRVTIHQAVDTAVVGISFLR